MGKTPAEETQLDTFAEKQELLEVVEHMEDSDKSTKPASPITTCPLNWSSIGDKERSSSSLLNGCTLSAGRDSMFGNVKRGIAVDHEAALPPSKRLHRALEAMKSANAAEAREDTPEVSSGMEVIPCGCTDSPNTRSLHLDETIGSPTRSPCIQSSDSIAFHNTASKLSSSLAFHEVVPDDSLTQSLRSRSNNDCKKTLVDAQEFDVSFTSEIAAVDTHENVKSVEKQRISGDRGGVLDSTLPLGGLGMNDTLASSKECSYSRKDVGNESNTVKSSLQKSDPVLNYKEGGDFLASNGTTIVALTTNVPTASKTSGSAKSPSSLSDESLQAKDINTSFQLQNFIHPCLLENDEGSGQEGKSFEAVTPEWKTEVEAATEPTQISNKKHRHILEGVVAPPCGVEVSSGCHAEQHQSLPFAPPPLPQDLPPSPPPLPSSLPPTAAPCFSSQSSVPQQLRKQSHAYTDLPGTNNIPNQQPQPITPPPNNFQGNSISSESLHYYTHGYGGFPKQIPPPPPSLSSSGPYDPPHSSILSGNDFQRNVNVLFPNKAYHLQPPSPSLSNQFSYIQAEPQQRQSWDSSTFGGRYQYPHDLQGGNHFADENTRGPIQHENSERRRFSSAINTGYWRPR